MGATVREDEQMQVYQLAMQMGVHSAELLDRARQLGMQGIDLDTVLTPDQVAALGGSPGARTAPPSWATGPVDSGALPPPPPPPAHSLAGPPWSGASTPAPPGPPLGAPMGGPAWVPPSMPTAAPQPPAPRGPSGKEGRSGVFLAIGVCAVAIIGFVVFVTTQGDADRRARRERAEAAADLAGRDMPDGGRAASEALGAVDSEPVDSEAADPLASDGWDRSEFCRSARLMMVSETEGMNAGMHATYESYLASIIGGRDDWKDGVDGMIAAEPAIAEDLILYRNKYETFLWSVDRGTSLEDLEVLANEVFKDDFILVAGRINRFIAAECPR